MNTTAINYSALLKIELRKYSHTSLLQYEDMYEWCLFALHTRMSKKTPAQCSHIGYVRCIIANLCKDWMRTRARKQILYTALSLNELREDNECWTTLSTDHEQHTLTRLQLSRWVKTLPTEQRRMIGYLSQNMSMEQMARKMNVPVGTVKSKLHTYREEWADQYAEII